MRLFANAAPRRLGSKSSVLREVVIESDASGAVARLALKKNASVDVKQMVLDNPPRIVLDLIPRTALARAPVTVTAKQGPARELAKAEPAPQPAPSRPGCSRARRRGGARAGGRGRDRARDRAARRRGGGRKARGAEARRPRRIAAGDELDARAARDAAAQAELDRLAGVRRWPSPSPPGRGAPPPRKLPASGEHRGRGGAPRPGGSLGVAKRRPSPRLASTRV